MTILVVGGAIILFNVVVPPRLGLLMELAVGVMLIALGVLNVSGAVRAPQDGEAHAHDPEHHPHAPDATPLARLDRSFGSARTYQLVRPLVIGIVHGLAGSAAVALLVLTTIRQPFWAILYLLLFGIGTIAGMVLITTAMAIPFAYAGQRMSRTRRGLQIATGVVSLVFGAVLAYQIGYVDGLFSASVHWTPH
jgi:high-affinity nickel-transport protein